jgi:hypothetical protein
MKAVPSDAELVLADASSVSDYFDKMELGECDINGNTITIEPPPPISAPKERSLADRLAKLLPLLYCRLAENGAMGRNFEREVARKSSTHTALLMNTMRGMLTEKGEADTGSSTEIAIATEDNTEAVITDETTRVTTTAVV